MAHNGNNEHKRNQGKTRLAMPSSFGDALRLLFRSETPHPPSPPRHSIVPRQTIRNPPRPEDKFPQTTSRSTETASPIVRFLIANARLKLSATHRKISLLRIPNRERIAFSNHSFSNRRAPGPARHSQLITHHFSSNRNCRSDQDRHPERPSGVEGTQLRQFRNSASGRSRQNSNRNTRFTGFQLTPLTTPLTQFLTATNPRCQFLATRLHRFSFHGIIGLLCSQ
jgi:hypothetical protein